MSMEESCLLTMWCPVYRRRESHSGFRMELENLIEDTKGKRTSGNTVRRKYPEYDATDSAWITLSKVNGASYAPISCGNAAATWGSFTTSLMWSPTPLLLMIRGSSLDGVCR